MDTALGEVPGTVNVTIIRTTDAGFVHAKTSIPRVLLLPCKWRFFLLPTQSIVNGTVDGSILLQDCTCFIHYVSWRAGQIFTYFR